MNAYDSFSLLTVHARAAERRIVELEAELASLRAEPPPTVSGTAPVETIRALQSAINWRGLDGDGISDPTRQQLIAVLASLIAEPPPWQSADSAPRDGSPFRVYGPALVDVDFTPSGQVEACFDGEKFIGAVWDGQHDVWRTEFIDDKFTHWQSIPQNTPKETP